MDINLKHKTVSEYQEKEGAITITFTDGSHVVITSPYRLSSDYTPPKEVLLQEGDLCFLLPRMHVVKVLAIEGEQVRVVWPCATGDEDKVLLVNPGELRPLNRREHEGN